MKKILLYLVTLVIVAACSSTDDPAPVTVGTIDLITKNATPGDIVIAKAATKPAITSSSSIKVGELNVQVFAGDSNQVLFIMPVVASGKVTVDYSGIGINKQLEFTVGAYTPITNPVAVANTFTTELDAVATKLEEYVSDPVIKLNPAYIEVLNEHNKAVKENFSKLTAEEQLKMAYMLRSVMLDNKDFALDAPNPGHFRTSSADDVSDEMYKLGLSFVKSMIVGTATLGLGSQLATLPSPLLYDKVAAGALSAVSISFFVKAHTEAQRIGGMKGIAENILASFSDNREGAISTESTDAAGEIEFNKGKVKTVTLSGDFRTLNQTDYSSSVGFINNTLKYISKLQDSYNSLVSIVNKIKSWFFGIGPELPLYANPVKAQSAKKELPLPASDKIGIKSISDTSIQLKMTPKTAGKFDIVATSTSTSLQDKPFSFDIVYTDKNLGVVQTKKITATYKPIQPNAVSIADGNNQTVEAGKALPKPLKVKVVDADGQVMKDIEVLWSIKSGNGTLSAAKSVTDAQGIAQVTWNMNQNPSGDQKVEAIVKKGDGTLVSGAPIEFSAVGSIQGVWNATKINGVAMGNWGSDGYRNNSFKLTLENQKGNWVANYNYRNSDGSIGTGNATRQITSYQQVGQMLHMTDSYGQSATYLISNRTATTMKLTLSSGDVDVMEDEVFEFVKQ